MPEPRPDPVVERRAQARRLADAGSWLDVVALLDADPASRADLASVALLAEALVRTGAAARARDLLVAVVPGFAQSTDRASLRRATVLCGAAHFELGELADARRRFNEALELARDDGDEPLVARAMNNLGAIDNVQGRRAEALAHYQLAVSMHQRLGSARGLAECYHNMAITYRDLGQLDEADELERRCVEHARTADLGRLARIARLGRAELALRRGDAALAEAAALRVAREFAEGDDPVREADALRLAGVAATTQGRPGEAGRLLAQALEQARRHGAVLNEAETLRAIAELRAATGDTAGALEDARAALAMFDALRATEETAALLSWIAALPRG